MRDLDTQIRDYFDELSRPVTIEDVFFATTEEPVRPLQRRGRVPFRRGWQVAAAAAVVVMLGALPFLLSGPGTEVPVVTQPPVPTTTAAPPVSIEALEEIALTFLEAVTAADASEAVALVAPDASVSLGGVDDVDLLEPWFAWSRAMRFTATSTGCQPLPDGRIRCPYAYTNPWMEAQGIAPWTGSSMTFTISGGLITEVTEFLSFTGYSQVWEGFKAWVDRAHPGQLERILTPDDRPILTDASIMLWEQFSEQFTLSFELIDVAEATVDALLAGDEAAFRPNFDPLVDIRGLTYLMGWNEALNYELIERRPCTATITTVTCVVTGRDDWSVAVGFESSDTFEFGFVAAGPQRLIFTQTWTVTTDPDGAVESFSEWITETHPELFEDGGACEGFFEGGPTPGDCALAWRGAADEYLDSG